ncbi:GYDIA family GHMP kinase [Flavobacterium tegetincola]|uniref:GYDIA family GHMP kinase n=1 Tax=Flavobacterium tegetincola TaxID=150172 RepID=UPI00041C9C4B|nr:GYDIA family GHMP kinase [Flavobacterium tegetincola]
MTKTFYSNGKLLMTGEYVVLDGAKAFALPTKMGQDLVVSETDAIGNIHWKSFDADQSIWFEGNLAMEAIVAKTFTDDKPSITKVLQNILFEAHQLNPTVLSNKGFSITTHLTFPRHWGLGTSSTLINNVATWFEINAFELLKNSFGGSGYDIANAQNNSPICFQIVAGKPTIELVHFNPEFKENLYFLYLNQKQDSKAAIAMYHEKQHDIHPNIAIINSITTEIKAGVNKERFQYLLEKHEALLSGILEMKTVKERFFNDFEGTIKSLGAWGGDFVLVVSETNPKSYFEEKGFTTLLPYHEMIL